MAEEHAAHEGGGMKDAGERIFVIIFFLFLLSILIYHFSGNGDFLTLWANIKEWYFSFIEESPFGRFIGGLMFLIKFIGTYISFAFVIAIIYFEMKLHKLHHEDHHMYAPHDHGHDSHHHEEEQPQKKKWQKVEEHLASENPSDWRLAILEADIMLEEMLEHKGIHGETIGDKLKNVIKSDFPNLDQAWEAHKIRNLIVHEGSNFLISKREAQRVVGLYRDIFQKEAYI